MIDTTRATKTSTTVSTSTTPAASVVVGTRRNNTSSKIQKRKQRQNHSFYFAFIAIPIYVISFLPISTSAFLIPNIAVTSTTMGTTTNSDSDSTTSLLLSERLSTDKLQVRVLGVCGGIGSGKSTACKWLASQSTTSTVGDDGMTHIHHLDADSLAHAVYSPGSKLIDEIVDEFGDQVLVAPDEDDDGKSGGDNNSGTTDTTAPSSLPTIDRKKLGAIVFADPAQMSKLERLVWPHVKTLIFERFEEIVNEQQKHQQEQDMQQKRLIVILEAAVLLDARWDEQLDGVWVVIAPRDVALTRLMETRNLSREESEKRIDAQSSRRGMGHSSIEKDVDNGVITGVIENSSTLEDLQEILISAMKDPTYWKPTKK
mmetsp:Transcript_1431/g.3169  ORF Transcript_1431/g.3169 Transcript_1431/m.3169 type:complete len:371 (+) Transcript_1431:129-1241(+)